MCAVSKPAFEKASSVPNTTFTKCAVCAGILTTEQVTLIGSDQAAAKLSFEEGNGAEAKPGAEEMLVGVEIADTTDAQQGDSA
eukprot:1770405-Pleurochrysis_carterae.AAC.1